jgi:cytochrome c oxidase assembly protein subunit 15
LIIIAVITFASAMAYREPDQPERGGRRPDLRRLAAALALGIPAQAVVGGLTVLFDLNPYLVGLHLLLSMVLIGLAVLLVRKTWGSSPRSVPPSVAALARLTFVALWVAVIIGTVLTGSGPHAGDERVPRNGLDGMLLTQLHSSVAYTTVALTLASVLLLRSRAALLLLAVEALQAGIGVAQYNLGLPVPLVALHLLGAALTVAAATNLLLSVRPLPRPVSAVDQPAQQHLGRPAPSGPLLGVREGQGEHPDGDREQRHLGAAEPTP